MQEAMTPEYETNLTIPAGCHRTFLYEPVLRTVCLVSRTSKKIFGVENDIRSFLQISDSICKQFAQENRYYEQQMVKMHSPTSSSAQAGSETSMKPVNGADVWS